MLRNTVLSKSRKMKQQQPVFSPTHFQKHMRQILRNWNVTFLLTKLSDVRLSASLQR